MSSQLNVYFLSAALVNLWFTVGFGAPAVLFAPLGPLLKTHIAAACLVSWGCLFNSLVPREWGSTVRALHKAIGYVALLAGTVSSVTGFVIVWQQPHLTTMNVGISIGGAMQLRGQFYGVWHILHGNVDRHQRVMTSVFVLGCCIPAAMRLPQLLGVALPDLVYVLLFPALQKLATLSLDARARRAWW